MKLKAGIYDPYLDTMGGGERYCLTVAEILSRNGYDVDIFWQNDRKIIDQAQGRFDLDLNNVNLVEDIFSQPPQKIDMMENHECLVKYGSKCLVSKNNVYDNSKKFLNKFKNTSKYDVFFYLSDGSVPFLFGKKNFVHVQVPFTYSINSKQKVLNSLKGNFIDKVICNSNFTLRFTEKYLGKKCTVLYPPVDIEKFNPNLSKRNTILSVGRFDNILNAKKQDVLIDAFRILVNKHHLSWKLILAGGSLVSPEKNHYLNFLKEKSIDLPVEFVVNPSFEDLKSIYAQSKIYWHAAGFDVDEDLHPEETEHFGITVVEAQSSGLVPIVVNKGGLKEIITNDVNGYLWNTLDELVATTNKVIGDSEKFKQISIEAIKSTAQFSKNSFEAKFMALINKSK